MDDHVNNEPGHHPRIELADGLPARHEPDPTWPGPPAVDAASGDYGLPVPEKPAHVCPACDYSLTGLTSRRCPECGTPFTLVEARRAGRRAHPTEVEDRRAQWWQHVAYAIGWTLIGGSVFAPTIAEWHIDRWLLFGTTGSSLLCLALAWMHKVYWQRTSAEAVLLAGLASAMISGFMIYLRW